MVIVIMGNWTWHRIPEREGKKDVVNDHQAIDKRKGNQEIVH